jgi:hypothetical protein
MVTDVEVLQEILHRYTVMDRREGHRTGAPIDCGYRRRGHPY